MTNSRSGVALALCAAALWGTTGTAQTFASVELASNWFGALRLLVASVFFAVYAGVEAWRSSASTSTDDSALLAPRLSASGVVAAGLCLAVYNLCFFAGVRSTGVAVGTAVALGSGPVWGGILQALIVRQKPPSAWWLGTIVAIAGGVAMTLSSSLSSSTRASAVAINPVGIGLCLLSGLSYAAWTLINKRLVSAAPASTVTLRTFSIAALIAIPLAWLQSGQPVIGAVDVGAVVYVGVVTAGVAYLLFSVALKHISAATGVTLGLAEPVMAFAMALIVVGERPAPPAFAGLLLVVAGVLVVVKAELASGRAAALAESPVTRAGWR